MPIWKKIRSNLGNRRQPISSSRTPRHHLSTPAFGAAGLEQVLDELLAARAEAAGARGASTIIILSDRMAGSDRIPIPSLLGLRRRGHHHLIRVGLRTLGRAWSSESGEPREVHHYSPVSPATAAEAINPYLAFGDHHLDEKDRLPGGARTTMEIIKALQSNRSARALLKVMSKMGISTISPYCGRADLRRPSG